MASSTSAVDQAVAIMEDTKHSLQQFRIFYNQAIHPELMRMERKRLRLLRLLFFSAVMLTGIIFFELYIGILPLTLSVGILIVLYLIYLGWEVRRFLQTFKPNVVTLVLQFISQAPNRGRLNFDAKASLPKNMFLGSRIFASEAQIYEGEDLIRGTVGQMLFELCELNVREQSVVSARTNYVFKGVFLHAVFPEDVRGTMAVWPREARQYLTRPMRNFVREGAQNQDEEITNPAFAKLFTTYATESTHVAGILTEPMQEAILAYHERTGKEIYLSFLEKDIYLAVTEPRDLLEPNIFTTNLSFELVRGFWEDINLLLEIVEEFDKTH